MTYANTIYGHKQKHALLGNLTIVSMAFLTSTVVEEVLKFST